MIKIIDGSSKQALEETRKLFREYESSIDVDLCFQGFEKELAELPGKYTFPRGRLLLATTDDRVAGCIALRPLQEVVCEMKRLYVRPEFRGNQIGSHLVTALIDAAREIGYQRMRLDTLPHKMEQALAMYHRYGFREIPPYYDNPVEGATFMELAL